MQSDDELALVVELLHQLALFFQCHVGTTPHHGTRLVAVGELAGHEAARIENQVGPLQHLPASHGYQVGVARAGSHNLDVALAQMTAVDGQCGGEVLPFHFFDD